MTQRTRVKICGCTSRGDVELALAWGADYVGFIFAPSPRRIALEEAARITADLPPSLTPVGVFVNPSRDELARALASVPRMVVQLSGDETPDLVTSVEAPIFKAVHVRTGDDAQTLRSRSEPYPGATILFDAYDERARGGTGRTVSWEMIAPIARERPVIVAGGLHPGNVAACIRTVRPFAVDVRSGVERDGRKDPVLVRAFMEAVRDADAA